MRADSPATGGTASVLVVGGGIAGATVGLELAAHGVDTLLLEAGTEPGARQAGGRGEATPASAGMLAPQYECEGPDPLFRFAAEARRAWRRFREQLEALAGDDPGYRRDGMLVANRTEAEDRQAREDARWQRAAGFRAELLTAGEARDLHAAASPDAVSYLLLPDEGQVDAQRLPRLLHAALGAADVQVRAGAEVGSILSDGSGVTGVTLADGTDVGGDAVVLSAGAWSGRVGGVPARLGVRPIRGQLLRLRPPATPPPPILARHGGRYLVPRSDGTVLVGSTMEDSGFRATTTPEEQDALERDALRLAPGFEGARRVEAWSGLRPVSADGRPVLGPDPGLQGLHYATGYGRNGILLAPLAARVVADLVTSGASELDWEPFGVQRLAST